jgi:hypothetical protein
MKTQGYPDPFPECKNCKTLGDCKHPDVAMDMMGSPLPPPECNKPIDVMKETVKQRKKIKDGLP